MNVTPHAPGVDVVDPDGERLARARAAHLDRPGERMPGVELGFARGRRLVAADAQPAFGTEIRTESPGSTVEHRLELAREVPVQVRGVERQLVERH